MNMCKHILFWVCIAGQLFISATTWNVFLYMDMSDNLCDMAFKNITDIMRGKPNDTVNVNIQLHAYNNIGLRYRIHNAHLEFIEEVILSGKGKQDFIQAASWAFADASDYTMLIFSNHGWGILNPRWNEATDTWYAAEVCISNNGNAVCPILPLKTTYYHMHKNHKGFMFNGDSHTYLTTQDLVEGLAYVQEHFLPRNKIDIVAFDTCMGSMLEIATCIEPYAHYLMGVQSCAMRDGFDYQQGMTVLNQELSPHETCIAWVDAFNTYYALHDESKNYTCSALDLTKVCIVNDALDMVVKKLLSYPAYIPLLKQARDETPHFCIWPIYADLITFCKNIECALEKENADVVMDFAQPYSDLKTAVKQMVVAQCSGSNAYTKANGFSIYLPFCTIDDSYYDTSFTQQSEWITLLKTLCDVNVCS